MEMDTVCNESAVLEIQRLQDDRRQLEEQIKNTRELLDAVSRFFPPPQRYMPLVTVRKEGDI